MSGKPYILGGRYKVNRILAFIFLVSIMAFKPAYSNFSNKKLIKVSYLKNIFGQIHLNPSRYSTSLTTISCGHPVKVFEVEELSGESRVLFNDIWLYVKVGGYEGYINKNFLSNSKPLCFQDSYPKFFDQFDLDLTELYYWGRLYDQYIQGKSKVN